MSSLRVPPRATLRTCMPLQIARTGRPRASALSRAANSQRSRATSTSGSRALERSGTGCFKNSGAISEPPSQRIHRCRRSRPHSLSPLADFDLGMFGEKELKPLFIFFSEPGGQFGTVSILAHFAEARAIEAIAPYLHNPLAHDCVHGGLRRKLPGRCIS